VAALTVIRAYIAAGRPEVTKKTWGTFEHWHDLIAKPLIWLGLPDPSETRTAFEEQADSPTSQTASLLGSWHRVYKEEAQLAGNVIRAVQAERAKDAGRGDTHILQLGDAIIGVCGSGKDADLPSAKTLGRKLAALKGCVEDGLRVMPGGEEDGTILWKVERLPAVKFVGEPGVDPESGMGDPMSEEELDELSHMSAPSTGVTNGTVNGHVTLDQDATALLDLV
jgi:hypothetical protein